MVITSGNASQVTAKTQFDVYKHPRPYFNYNYHDKSVYLKCPLKIDYQTESVQFLGFLQEDRKEWRQNLRDKLAKTIAEEDNVLKYDVDIDPLKQTIFFRRCSYAKLNCLSAEYATPMNVSYKILTFKL